MKKIIYLVLLQILALNTTAIFAQIEQQETQRFDEFLIYKDDLGDIYATSPCYTNCGGEDLQDFTFTWDSNFETILANEKLLERARREARREWANKQRTIMKGLIEQKFNQTFPSFEAAREALFTRSISENIVRNSKSPKQTFGSLVNTGKSNEVKHIRNLKLLKIRELEIKAGKIYNSDFNSFQVNGKLLKDIRDITTLNQYLNQEIYKFGNNRATLHVNDYTLKKLNNLGASFTTEVNKKKTNFYNTFDYDWGKVNFMQFMIIYEDYKRRIEECLMCVSINEWGQITNGLKKFYGVDIAKPDYIRNYALQNRGGGISVFDGGYVDYMISKHQGYYDEPDFIQDAIYDGYEREQESETKAVLDEIFNSASLDDLRIQNLIEDLGYDTNSATANWLRNRKDTSLQAADFLDENKVNNTVTAEAKAYVKGQVELEFLTQDSKRNWKPSTGIIANNPHLKYTHSDKDADRAYFKMEDGSIVVTSGEEQELTSSGDLTNKYRDTAGNSFGQFYYIKLPGEPWAEMLFNPNNLGDELQDFFALAGLELGKSLGRYVLPIEDIKILIDGKDFDGQDVARWKAAGGILLTVVPAGKIIGTGAKVLKPVLKIADDVVSWSKVITWGNRTFKLRYEVINGVINYGDRSQLARILKTTTGIEAHHIIPWAKCNHKVVESAARVGFHPNMVENGLGLQKYTKLIGEGLHGNHPAYDKYVLDKLELFKSQYPGFTPEQAKDFLLNVLIPDLKNKIILAKNSGLNLNEFFKQII